MATKCPCCGEQRTRFAYFAGCGHYSCDDCYADFCNAEVTDQPLFQCYDCDAPVMTISWAGAEGPEFMEAAAVCSRSRLDSLFRVAHRVHRLCVVIHCRLGGAANAVEQAAIAFDNGADGVFLIIHRKHIPADLLVIYEAVREAHPLQFIGLNFLGTRIDIAMELVPLDCEGLWTDDGIDGKLGQNGVDAQIPRALGIRLARKWPGLLFAAFAFKYRTAIPDDQLLSRGAIARQLLDVPTTSGPATGIAMTAQRAHALRAAIGENATLAAASGISLCNALDLVPYFDIVLAASSLEHGEDYSGLLIPEKVRQLADLVQLVGIARAAKLHGVQEDG